MPNPAPDMHSLNKEANIARCTLLADKDNAAVQNSLGKIYYQYALLHKDYHTKARILFEKVAS